MTKKIAGIPEKTLLAWIGASLCHGRHVLGRGYQCHTLLYRDSERSLVVKAPLGRGLAAAVRRRMLKNEYAVYKRLAGLPGIPRCHGFLENRYLVLDYIDGVPIQGAQIQDREHFFGTLLQHIESMHRAGVAHGDLKKKDNILVVDGRHPVLLDFGVAVIRKPRPMLLNRHLFHLFVAFDFNAYVKLKYGKRTDLISAADRRLYRRTLVEKSTGWIKRRYLQAKKILAVPPNR